VKMKCLRFETWSGLRTASVVAMARDASEASAESKQ
jgi:hypothetical protein